MLFLGCDGGSTKFTYIISDERGKLLADRQFPGLNIIEMGAEPFMRAFVAQIEETLRAASVDPASLAGSAFAITGYGESRESVSETREAATAALGHDRFVFANDAVAGWSGALMCRPGIVVASGTGSVAYGEDGKGGAGRAGGWSLHFGDEGSSYWIAKQAINLFFRQADGRTPRTALYDHFMRLFALEDPLHLPMALEDWTGGEVSRLAGLQREVLKVYEAGDAAVRDIYRRAGDELAQHVQALMGRLDFGEDQPVTVSYTGGLFKAGACMIQPFETGLARLHARAVPPAYGPAVGAVCYAARPHLPADALERMFAAVDAARV